jgi:hypothetical protein
MEDEFYRRNKNLRFIKSKVDLNVNDPLREVIEKKFSDPNKYFEFDDKVIIGKYFIKYR